MSANKADQPMVSIDHSSHTDPKALTDQQVLAACEHLLKLGKDVELRTRGGSMVPTIFGGEIVILGPTINQSVRKGDIVFAKLKNQKWVLHRVHDATISPPKLRGDALLEFDEGVEEICGLYKGHKNPLLHRLRVGAFHVLRKLGKKAPSDGGT
ncbi:MAG: S24/S26 family peptidase [Planctomycetes bacterium]|nr:S24/S26 family peptidase [Planctomycetota bacterium]